MLYKELENKVCAQATIGGDYEKYVEEYAGFAKGNCADQGFKHADGSKEVSIPIVGDLTLALYDNLMGNEEATLKNNKVTFWEVKGDFCEETTVLLNDKQSALEYDKDLKEGDCKSQGYTIWEDDRFVMVDPFFFLKFDDYKKTPTLGNPKVTFWEVKGDVCSEATVPIEQKSEIIQYDGDLKEGDCKSQGYTIWKDDRFVMPNFMFYFKMDDYLKTPSFQALI